RLRLALRLGLRLCLRAVRLGGLAVGLFFRLGLGRRVEVRVPAASLQDEVAAADLPLRGRLAALGTDLDGVLRDLLNLLPGVLAARAEILVRRHCAIRLLITGGPARQRVQCVGILWRASG